MKAPSGQKVVELGANLADGNPAFSSLAGKRRLASAIAQSIGYSAVCQTFLTDRSKRSQSVCVNRLHISFVSAVRAPRMKITINLDNDEASTNKRLNVSRVSADP